MTNQEATALRKPVRGLVAAAVLDVGASPIS
jgi:hypothetical protein